MAHRRPAQVDQSASESESNTEIKMARVQLNGHNQMHCKKLWHLNTRVNLHDDDADLEC